MIESDISKIDPKLKGDSNYAQWQHHLCMALRRITREKRGRREGEEREKRERPEHKQSYTMFPDIRR